MHANPSTTEQDVNVADATERNWVDRYAPRPLRPWLRLARLDRPIGFWLLLLPCWWSVGLAEVKLNQPYPSPWLLFLFAAGALLMRAAGCAYNDYIDRDYDARTARGASRPIPAGQIRPISALVFTVLCSLAGLAVLLQFNSFTIKLGAASLLLVAIYPFMKRFTNWPQLILGLAFNWGALVGWSAATGSIAIPALLLYAGSVLWTIGYDTIYAHQDREDDLMLGLRSTAIRFGENTMTWVGSFYAGAIVLWLLAGFLAGAHLIFFLAIVLASLQMAWQVTTLDTRDGANCLRRFRSNRDVGMVIFLGLVADMAISRMAGLS
ncbi:4-hydroxybenzoate octaprenyltransferase [Hyphomicrobium sulfonivorans]|uniref:4-hydroxybenzoate octaprenyltransferase n=1 Tax=Hyphomicrobium sulfonivorans TaxID=121290 RepID=UPI00156DB622|nr:4-hydroxybenzoate octaprenyltransferase [Hyphomicrobium sulfonivorans]MBI1651110.1 4-hydroxybenzoate octaprenyltransferase [Hyphomicrobium sulfonivorans]NSL72506.1 4-hydroxybenzoate octaprenyltransferase [Hyphomicrobium sulfonivorans]